jgi:D-3-phosphoglycerate dehydrogenase
MAAQPVDAVISRTVDLTAKAIDSCPTLRVVSKHGVGVPNIDVAACTRRGIPVYVTPGANAQSVAELTIGLMIAAARKVSWMDREIREGRWPRVQDGLELQGRMLGLVGFGQIGQRVARTAVAIGMRVSAFDPVLTGPSPVDGVTLVGSLDDLLAATDVLSLHVPLTPKTRAMIGAAQLARLRKGAVLVNTARGEVVDEPALIDAMRSGQVFAAGLDTTAEEPITRENPLLALPNVVLTPHVGGSTPGALAAMARGAAENVINSLEGRPVDPASCVNPEVLSIPSQS